MVHINEFVTVHARIIKVGNAVGFACRSNARCHLIFIAHNDEECGGILCILVLDETLDGIGACADYVGIVDINIDTFHGLPSHPVLDAAFEHTVSDDQHLHW